MTSSETLAAFPYFAPVDRESRIALRVFLAQFVARGAERQIRGAIAVTAGALALVPVPDNATLTSVSPIANLTRSHAPVQPIHDEQSGSSYAENNKTLHVLHHNTLVSTGGASFLIGLWSVRQYLFRLNFPARSVGWGPRSTAKKHHMMRRELYAGRVCFGMLLLALDMALNLVTDTVHWRQLTNGSWTQDLLASIILLGCTLVFRLGFIAVFFLTVVSTAHFRLGRYAELTSEFGSAVLIMLIAFAVSIMLRVVRVVMGARRDAVYSRANSFWTDPPLGVFYSVKISLLVT